MEGLFSSFRIAATLLAVVVGSGGAPTAHAQDSVAEPAPDLAAFESEYQAATRLMTLRSWKGAQNAWLELLRRHAGMEYVAPRVEEIRAALQKSAFWLVTKEPEPKAAVSGNLRSYSTSSGQIEIRYTRESLADFERKIELDPRSPEALKAILSGPGTLPVVHLHPLTFRGGYTLALKGTAEELLNASLYVALDQGQGVLVRIGGEAGLFSYHHRILRLGGNEPEVLGELPFQAPAGKGKRKSDEPAEIEAQVRVDSRAITLTYNGKKLLSVANERKVYGQWGLGVRGPFGELTLKGTIEPSWIDGRQDALVQSAREAFDAGWVEPPELAPWKDARPRVTAEVRVQELLSSISLPGLFTPAQQEMLEHIQHLREKKRARGARDYLLGLAPQALPDAARALLLTLCEVEDGRPAEALRHLEEFARLETPSSALRFLRAYLLGQLERLPEAIERLSALAAEEDEPLVHLELTRDLLRTGHLEEARAALERAARGSAPLAELAELRVQLAKARLGPEWRKSFTHASERFAVGSDLDAEICRVAVRELDEAWGKCCQWFGEVTPPATPSRVYLFSGESSYLGYIRGIASESPENSLGVYSPLLDQIAAWNSADRELLLRTLWHECAHHYFDLALGEVPIWLNEGLAEYLAASRLASQKWQEGAPNASALLVLARHRDELTPLAAFLRLDQEAFLRKAELHYPQAWAWCHFLRSGQDPTATAFLERLWLALLAPTDAPTALATALEGVDIAAVEKSFQGHMDELARAGESR